MTDHDPLTTHIAEALCPPHHREGSATFIVGQPAEFGPRRVCTLHAAMAQDLAASVRAWLTTDPNSPLAAVESVLARWDDVLDECKAIDPLWILDRSVTTLETVRDDLRAALTATHPTKEQQP